MSSALHDLQPDPLEPRAEEVERYVAALIDHAGSDPDSARREAWRQIRLAGARAGARPGEASDTLNRVFRLGRPPSALDGFHEGIIVAPLFGRAVDPGLRAVARAWMPWAGKRFDSAAEAGENLLDGAARLPMKLVWPSYRLETTGDGRCAGFRFRTSVGPGSDDPDREVLRLDYDLEENPGFLIRDLLDELVEVVPGVLLGKIMLRRGAGERRLVGYFALRPPQTVRVEEPVAASAMPAPAPA